MLRADWRGNSASEALCWRFFGAARHDNNSMRRSPSRRRTLVHQRHRSPCPAAYRRGKHRNHPGVDIDDVGQEEPGAAPDITERRGVDARPGKPMPDVTVRFPAQHFLPHRRTRRVDLGDNDAARCEEIGDPPQGTNGVDPAVL